MCPACLATVALIAAGASSTGGIGALALRALCGKPEAEDLGGGGAPDLTFPSAVCGDGAALQETNR